MKYMMMMFSKQKDYDAMGSWSSADVKAMIEFMHDFNRKLVASGEFVLAEGLDMPHAARVVTAQPGGVPIVSDGPFPESKEFLAGFWIVDVASAERAYELAGIASACPGKGGQPIGIAMEVRGVPAGPPPVE